MRRFLNWVAGTSTLQRDLGLIVLRLWFGLGLAFGHGLSKVANFTAWNAKVAKMGVPAPELLGTLAALGEFLGGIFLALGLLTRGAAAAVLGVMGVAVFRIHAGHNLFYTPGKPSKELAVVYAVGALALLLSGPGRLSVDHLLFGKRPKGGQKGGPVAPDSEHDGQAGLGVKEAGKKDADVEDSPRQVSEDIPA